jgi:UDPglucose 6-dehydrogenase
MKSPVVGFAGMTHLGLVSGACGAEKGFDVVLFDPDEACISGLKRSRLPVSEPGLDELVARNAEHMRLTDSAADLAPCDVIFIASDVPTDDEGRSDLGPIDELLRVVFEAAMPCWSCYRRFRLALRVSGAVPADRSTTRWRH